MIEIEFANGGW